MPVLVLPLIFVFTALTVLVFAFGARRLLGLRFSFLRTLIAGVLAFLIASPIITAISGSVVAKRTSVLPELWFVILGVTIEARRFAGQQLAGQFSPDTLRTTAADELVALLPLLRRLPRRIDRIGGALEAGRLSVNVRLLADEGDRRIVTGLLYLVLTTFLAATSGIMAVLMLGLRGGPTITSRVSLFQFLGYCLLVISAILALLRAVTRGVPPLPLCGPRRLTRCRCLPCLLTSQTALTPSANPPGKPGLHHSHLPLASRKSHDEPGWPRRYSAC